LAWSAGERPAPRAAGKACSGKGGARPPGGGGTPGGRGGNIDEGGGAIKREPPPEVLVGVAGVGGVVDEDDVGEVVVVAGWPMGGGKIDEWVSDNGRPGWRRWEGGRR
jgi:hypothetical protein